MHQYKELLNQILEHGQESDDRTGVGTLSLFGAQFRHNLQDGFPLLTEKKVPWKSVLSELLWFMEGSHDERRLAEILYGKDRSELIGKNTIWTANADKQGKDLGYENTDTYKGLGPVYGMQWRSWQGYDIDATEKGEDIDQLKWLVDRIKTNPDCRRMIVSAWNVADLSEMALPPCHLFWQVYVRNGKLSIHMYMRSADMFLGVPFNIASYAAMTHILAHLTGYDVGDLIISFGDAHIYKNHIDQVKTLLDREPRTLPELVISDRGQQTVDDFVMDDFEIVGYDPHDAIKADMAV